MNLPIVIAALIQRTTALRQERPFHKRARSANVKITGRSLTIHQCSAVTFPAIGLRFNVPQGQAFLGTSSPTPRNTQSPPFALVVMPNAIGCAVI
jgi:hypothetical protein